MGLSVNPDLKNLRSIDALGAQGGTRVMLDASLSGRLCHALKTAGE